LGGTKGHVPSPFWFGFFEIYRINSQKWKEEHAPHASVGTEVGGSCQKRLQSDGSSLFHCWLLGNQINVPCLIIWIRDEAEGPIWEVRSFCPHLGVRFKKKLVRKINTYLIYFKIKKYFKKLIRIQKHSTLPKQGSKNSYV